MKDKSSNSSANNRFANLINKLIRLITISIEMNIINISTEIKVILEILPNKNLN